MKKQPIAMNQKEIVIPYELPENWKWTKLGEVCDVIMGQSPPSKTYNKNRIGLSFFQGKAEFGEIYPIPKRWCSKPKKIAEPNDILISVRAPVGPTNLCKEKSCIGRGLAAMRPKSAGDSKYIFYYLRSIENELSGVGSGSTFSEISKDYIESLLIPFPLLKEEKKRIVAKIDFAFSRLARSEKFLEESGKAIDKIMSAAIKQAIPTEDPLPEGWRWVKLGDIVEFLDSKRIPVSEKERKKRCIGKSKDELYPYYGANGQVGWIDGYIFDEELILLAEDGGYFGSLEKPIAYKISGKSWVNNHAHVLRPKNNVDIDFLLNASKFYDIMPFVRGTTRLKLNQGDAKVIPIPHPLLREQKSILTHLNTVSEHVDKLKTLHGEARERVERVKASLLSKAFKGEI